MRTFRRPALAVFVLVHLFPTFAWSQGERVGVVTTLEGNVTARRAVLPQPVPLKFKDDVFFRDTITTGDQSLARVLLGGKSIVTVRERSVVTITESPGRSYISLESGKIGLAVAREKLAPGESVDVRTPNAVVGVRGTVIVAEVVSAATATSHIYFLRGSGECFAVDQRTGRPIGSPVTLKPLESFKVVGSAARVEPIPASQIGQITAGLEGKGIQHKEAANQEQVKAQVAQATSAVLNAVLGGGVGAAIVAAENSRTLPQTQTAPIVPPIAQALAETQPPPAPSPPAPAPDVPEITITGSRTLASGESLKSFSGTTVRTLLSPFAMIGGTPIDLPGTAAELKANVFRDGLTPAQILAAAQSFGFTTVQQLGFDNLFEVVPGASVTLAGPLVKGNNSVVFAGNSVLNIAGALTGMGTSGLIDLDPSAYSAVGNFVSVGPGATMALAGALMTAADSIVTTTANVLQVGGGTIAASASNSSALVALDRSTMIATSRLVDLQGGATLDWRGTLVASNAGQVTLGGSLFNVAGGSVLRMAGGSLLSLANGSTTSILDGAFLVVSGGSVFQSTSGPLATFAAGRNTLALQNAPLCSTGTCIRLLSTAFNILLRNGAIAANVLVDPSFVAFVGLGGDNGITGVDASRALLVLDGETSRLLLGSSVAPSLTIGPGQLVDRSTGIPQVFSMVTITGGTLTGSDSVTAAALQWTGGQIAGTGALIVSKELELTTSGFKDLRSRTLTSAGTAHFSDTGFLSLAQGAVFNNTGRFEALSDADVANFFGGSATFLNAGTLIKTGAGTTTAFSGVTFNNTGTVDVQSGALSLAAGGTSSGAFTIGGAATLEFAGGISTLTTASSVAGTGTLRFASGTTNLLGTYLATGPLVLTGGDATFNTPNSIQATSLTLQGGTATFNTPLTAGSLSLSGGGLTGTGNVTVPGLTTWTGGQIAGSGTLLAAGGLELTSSGFKDLRGRTLTSPATAHFGGTGFLALAQGAVFSNTGVFEALSDADVANFFGGSATFLNAGTLIKTGAGTTTAFSGVTFNNTGTVDVQSGTLSLAAGGTSSGAFTIGGAATLEFAGGVSTLTTASSVAGTGTLRFASGTTNLLGTYLATGPLVFTGGSASFDTLNDIQAASLILQAGTGTFNRALTTGSASISGGTLSGTGDVTVSGPTTWTGGQVAGSGALLGAP